MTRRGGGVTGLALAVSPPVTSDLSAGDALVMGLKVLL